jgi:hypothetical protein
MNKLIIIIPDNINTEDVKLCVERELLLRYNDEFTVVEGE